MLNLIRSNLFRMVHTKSVIVVFALLYATRTSISKNGSNGMSGRVLSTFLFTITVASIP